jgi:hypothetical protein
MPAMGQRYTPTFHERPAPEYDGLGRKKARPSRPQVHNAKRRTREWRDYATKVVATHRVLPDGSFQEDPRDDKYLHSHARWGRDLRDMLARSGR